MTDILPPDTVHLLKSRSVADRIRAMQQIARNAQPAYLPQLLEGLRDKSSFVATIAAEALSECADLDSQRDMIAQFHRFSLDGPKLDPGCHIRANLAYAFGRLESLHADEVLRIGIRTIQIEPVGGVKYDTGAHLRANCALALGQIRCQAALRDIALLLFDDGKGMFGRGDPRLIFVEPRKAAARALGLLSTEAARVPLTLRLCYPDGESAEVLQECMQALVDLEDPDAPEVLMRFVEGPNEDLAVYAGLMLARSRSEGAEEVLVGLVQRYSGNALKAAVLALASLRTDGAKLCLQQLASGERKVVCDAIAELDLA